MAKKFQLLRRLLHDLDIDQTYLAEIMGYSTTYISNRFLGKYAWTLDDQYKLMEIVNWPAERMHELFPKGGVGEATKADVSTALNVTPIDNNSLQEYLYTMLSGAMQALRSTKGGAA